ncbi:hypothetical protein [Pseudoxanthomonas winnipegensis]|uniref:Uncharacterized protein n=1 Tax=Pseudoxanthomonas winnipegensis TaxID=2480810 RepID=A0A4Q8M4G6_9GAMM|nr:hypothetical protein [Pseudoxanthomonas winnipegensis]TAA41545.1 hypothetical protein EA655_11425 [Pseudoxanthomonas winnipegensis]
MQNKITKTTTSDLIQVSLPFAFKDSFKATFKTAKWDGVRKTWNIKNSAVSANKLDAWIKEVDGSGVIDALNAVDEEAIDQKTIEAIQADLIQIRSGLQASSASAEQRQKTLDLLSVLREELAAERKKRDDAQTTAKQQKADIEKALGELVDMPAMRRAYAIMRRTHHTAGANSRTDFNAAQSTLVDFYNMLNKYGFHSETLDKITDANFNRPDRDGLERHPFEKIFEDLIGDGEKIMRIALKPAIDEAEAAQPRKM